MKQDQWRGLQVSVKTAPETFCSWALCVSTRPLVPWITQASHILSAITEIGSRRAIVITPSQSSSMLWSDFGHGKAVIYQAPPTVPIESSTGQNKLETEGKGYIIVKLVIALYTLGFPTYLGRLILIGQLLVLSRRRVTVPQPWDLKYVCLTQKDLLQMHTDCTCAWMTYLWV